MDHQVLEAAQQLIEGVGFGDALAGLSSEQIDAVVDVLIAEGATKLARKLRNDAKCPRRAARIALMSSLGR